MQLFLQIVVVLSLQTDGSGLPGGSDKKRPLYKLLLISSCNIPYRGLVSEAALFNVFFFRHR